MFRAFPKTPFLSLTSRSTLPSRLPRPARSFSGAPKRPQYKTYFAGPNQPTFQPPPPRKRSRLFRFVGFTAIAFFAFHAGLLLQTCQSLYRIMEHPILTNEETLSAYEPTDSKTEEIEHTLRTHPEAEALRANPNFTEARPHLKIPDAMRGRSLTAGTLAGPGKIVVPPYVFSEADGKSMVSLMYLGSDVCGHPGIVHGGLLATLLDEGMARCCFPALPNKVAVTANLNIDYRAPAMADQYVALRAETVKVEGRKAWVEGRIETLPTDGQAPVVLVESKALFIEPKQAAVMKSLYKVA